MKRFNEVCCFIFLPFAECGHCTVGKKKKKKVLIYLVTAHVMTRTVFVY